MFSLLATKTFFGRWRVRNNSLFYVTVAPRMIKLHCKTTFVMCLLYGGQKIKLHKSDLKYTITSKIW